MKKFILYLAALLLLQQYCQAQQNEATDSSTLQHITITAFEQDKEINCGTIVKVINNNNADRNNKTSLVNGFNTIAGVRMEERSPGSYRINIRGSSLRSPFGVRNVKIYWNDIPVTDAGGNTYFNQFAFNNFSSIEIVKGPAGSMYGAGTGGLLLMRSVENNFTPSVNVEYIAGSYRLQNILAGVGFGNNDQHTQLTYAHNESNGYRNNSAAKKDNVSWVSQFKPSVKQQITASILYSDLYYQTPGGLTITEFNNDPKQARPAAGGLPSAGTAKATIYQKNFLAGINQQYHFTGAFKNSTSLYGSFAQIQNPTFRNYERRNEPGFGGRSTFIFDKTVNGAALQLLGGGELQEGFFNTQVSKNKNGQPDTLQTNDDIHYDTYSIFAQADIGFRNWNFTAGASINRSKVDFKRLSSYPVLSQTRTYKNELSPRIAIQKKIGADMLFASISRGFSPPTIAELLPSTSAINTFLEAEEGFNYELGGRFLLLKNKLRIEATGFYFKLNNALVSRKDSSNADYFINAGNTQQKGIELSADYTAGFNHFFMEDAILKAAYSYSNFKYGDFKKGTTDFNGNDLPSVPKNTFSLTADIHFKKGFYCNNTYYLSGRIFLDDANSVAENSYHLLGSRVGYKKLLQKIQLNFYFGADNLFNETYSLGNDINAAAGRYYNAAPKRNYYAGIALQWLYDKK